MGYFRYRLRCKKCNNEWNTYFSSEDLTQGVTKCICGNKDTEDVGPWLDVDGYEQ